MPHQVGIEDATSNTMSDFSTIDALLCGEGEGGGGGGGTKCPFSEKFSSTEALAIFTRH